MESIDGLEIIALNKDNHNITHHSYDEMVLNISKYDEMPLCNTNMTEYDYIRTGLNQI